MPSAIDEWTKTFAIIVQTSKTALLRGGENQEEDIQEFYDQAFGHAAMVIKGQGELLYKGYRPNVNGHRQLREGFYNLYHNLQNMTTSQKRETVRTIGNILKQGMPAVIRNEGRKYRPRHEKALTQIVDEDLCYRDWNHNEAELHQICAQVEQDHDTEKYYSLLPDTTQESGNLPPDAIIHNCVTWIIETQRKSIISLLLPDLPNGNVSQLAQHLQ
jgi:hypothetical protein